MLIEAHRLAKEVVSPAQYSITSKNASDYLERGKMEYKASRLPAAEMLLRMCLTCARLCGDLEIELKSLFNLATTLKDLKKLVF